MCFDFSSDILNVFIYFPTVKKKKQFLWTHFVTVLIIVPVTISQSVSVSHMFLHFLQHDGSSAVFLI